MESENARPMTPTVLGIVGGVAMVIGSFLTWATVSVNFDLIAEAIGIEPSQIPAGDPCAGDRFRHGVGGQRRQMDARRRRHRRRRRGALGHGEQPPGRRDRDDRRRGRRGRPRAVRRHAPEGQRDRQRSRNVRGYRSARLARRLLLSLARHRDLALHRRRRDWPSSPASSPCSPRRPPSTRAPRAYRGSRPRRPRPTRRLPTRASASPMSADRWRPHRGWGPCRRSSTLPSRCRRRWNRTADPGPVSPVPTSPHPRPDVRSAEFQVDTSGRRAVDVTERVRAFVADTDGDGLVHVFVPHATAGVALMETGSGSEGDLEDLLERLLPRDDRYAHRHGSVGHGGDHLLPVLVSPSVILPVVDRRLALGTWQSVVLVDPNRENNRRTMRLSFVPA